MALRGGLFHALLNSHDSESNQSGRSTRITCFFQALVSRWIRLLSRWIQPIRKKHTDRVFLSNEVRKIFSISFNHKPVLQALCFFQLTLTNQEEAHGSRVSFKRFLSRWIRLVSRWIRLVVAYI